MGRVMIGLGYEERDGDGKCLFQIDDEREAIDIGENDRDIHNFDPSYHRCGIGYLLGWRFTSDHVWFMW